MTPFLRIDKSRSSNTPEDILSRIVKLAPSEVVGLYLLGKGVADPSWLGIWSSICLALVLILRIWGTKSQWPSVLISFVSFGIWVLAIGDPILTFPIPDGRILSLVILVFTFLVPIFYKGTD
jgi:hypothetical protein